ncbi:FecR domain-containing protein [Candidatus Desantisbacteria bacterium]|nr:FecR domain-containing protein [Candidatus Desantisbacteria bacterium]
MINASRMYLIGAFLIGILLIPIHAKATATTQEQEIILTKVSGRVEVQNIGDVKWKKAGVGTKLKSNQRIRTFEKSRAYLDLGEGSSMVIISDSIMDILELKKQIEGQNGFSSKVKLWIGKIRTEIKKLDKDSSFEVVTPTTIAGVRGTIWSNFVMDDESSSVFVKNGNVWIKNLSGTQEYMASEGQISNISPAGELSIPTYTTPEQQKEFEQQWQEEVEPVKETPVKKEKVKKEETEEPVSPPVASEEKSQDKKGKKGLTCGGILGSKMIDGKYYSEIVIQPDISFGKLGIGLNILARWNEDGFRNEDWDDAGNIIRFVRWAEKGAKPLYARLGTMDKAILGHGFILNRYSNQGTDTGRNILGSEIDVNLKNSGVETVVNNITDPRLFGGRLYCKPLKMMNINIPILSRIDLGLSGVTDTEPQQGNKEALTIYGVDLGMPIFGNLLKVYADTAQIQDFGHGIAYGLGGEKHVGWINADLGYKIEMRNLGEKFVPGVFNSLYEVMRPGTSSISSAKKSSGQYAEASLGILKAINMVFSMENFKEGDPRVHGELGVNSDLISRIARQNIGVSFSYDQIREKGSSLFKLNAKNSVTTQEITYGLSDKITLAYIYRGVIDKNGVKTKTASVATKMSF